jgi:FkbM family methyltransferase
MFFKRLIKFLFAIFGLSISRKNRTFHANTKHFFELIKTLDFHPVLIIDIGAHKGDWSRTAAIYFKDSYFVLVEPQDDLVRYCKDLMQIDNFMIYHQAIGNLDGIAFLNKHKRKDSYFISENTSDTSIHEQESVKISTLDKFISDNLTSYPNPDVLKIDAEGLDLEILKGAKHTLKKLELIFIEAGVYNFRFNNSILEVIRVLEREGFMLLDITDLNRPYNLKILWNVELVFIRKGGHLNTSIDYILENLGEK